MTKIMTWRPRISWSGFLILVVYVSVIGYLFQISSFYKGGRSRALANSDPRLGLGLGLGTIFGSNENTCTLFARLNAWTCATSFLNVMSHFGVTLGVLDDTLVLSILIGVGFDVATRLLQLAWWIYLHLNLYNYDQNQMDSPAICLLAILVYMYCYHMLIHVRALSVFLCPYSPWLTLSPAKAYASRKSTRVNVHVYAYHKLIQDVLTSALNNLRGIPGEKHRDHLFAYTDLGSHLLACVLSFVLLRLRAHDDQAQKITHATSPTSSTTIANAVKALMLLSFMSYIYISFPFVSSPLKKSEHDLLSAQEEDILLSVDSDGTLFCRCVACKNFRSRMHQKGRVVGKASRGLSGVALFTFNPRDGVCRQWLKSFGTLQSSLSHTKNGKLR